MIESSWQDKAFGFFLKKKLLNSHTTLLLAESSNLQINFCVQHEFL